jgi:hypothetical protein
MSVPAGDWRVLSPRVTGACSSPFDNLADSQASDAVLRRKMAALVQRFAGSQQLPGFMMSARIAKRMREHHRRRLEHYTELRNVARKRCQEGSACADHRLELLDEIIAALGSTAAKQQRCPSPFKVSPESPQSPQCDES